MKTIALLACIYLLNNGVTHAQKATVITPLGALPAGQGYSKEVSLYQVKQFVVSQILGPSIKPIMFEADALSASSSGELTALVYKCMEKQKEGMVLAFWGSQISEAGVPYQAYGFKDLGREQANELLIKLQAVLGSAPNTLKLPESNLYFQYDDMTFLLYNTTMGQVSMRVFWHGFDSEWNIASFNRTKRRLEKKI